AAAAAVGEDDEAACVARNGEVAEEPGAGGGDRDRALALGRGSLHRYTPHG
ncbi:MAG: hypothetical protein JWN65_1127, partial [Solirubrobacterales bacterium]|nr:hypothetical protein [Solirubrobacterales bacterium]